MCSVKSQIHMGIFSRREMNVLKQKVSEVLTRGTKYAVFLRWGFKGTSGSGSWKSLLHDYFDVLPD